ncbi:hypothetical protein CORC01_11740 [Colletotrichum orchidophilum]|uniref:Uncharacterized protein n=1 Tax=Colletotrichum orchidophilum TaxID=1209926 RepID=A0A1G4AUV4_9PEZI|nr:uncharacterized protein CORC01_11740 [Colletotrichum orchidophilum]OHE92947.1 hypothetical protein CORC01_11740 [Colletotrichum orchidophilum]
MGLEGAIDVGQGNASFDQSISVRTSRGRQHHDSLRDIREGEKRGSKGGMPRDNCLHNMRRSRSENTLGFGRNRRGGPVNIMSCPEGWSVAEESLEEVAMMVPMTAIAASRTTKVPTIVAAPRDDDMGFSILEARISDRRRGPQARWMEKRKSRRKGQSSIEGRQGHTGGQAAGMRSTMVILEKNQGAERRRKGVNWSSRKRTLFDDSADNVDTKHQRKARSNIEDVKVAKPLVESKEAGRLDHGSGPLLGRDEGVVGLSLFAYSDRGQSDLRNGVDGVWQASAPAYKINGSDSGNGRDVAIRRMEPQDRATKMRTIQQHQQQQK